MNTSPVSSMVRPLSPLQGRGQRALLLSCVGLLAACRAPSSLPKAAPFDFDAAPGPALTAFASESQLGARWPASGGGDLRAFWDEGQAGALAGVDGVPVAWRRFPATNSRAAVVLMPGRTEAIIKYAEVAADLVGQGYTVFALTLRGQGEAGRMLPDPDKGYVAWFDDYVTDTHRFLTEVVRPAHERVFVLAHSLSGSVATVVNDRYPGDMQALALSAPMLDINLGAFPAPVAATLGLGVCSSTDGSGYAVGGGPWADEALSGFANNTVTSSEPRWNWKVKQLQDDPAIRLGGVTWRWLCQALAGSSEAQAVGRYSETPTLLLQAGQDSFVNRAGQDRYCADAPRCTKVRLEESMHEVLQERDAVRNLALARVVAFFDAEVTP